VIPWLAIAALAPVTLAFGGDVMLARGIERAGAPPFGAAAPVLRAADLAFVNLECPLTERPFARRKVVHLRGRPERVGWLVEAGIDGVSVANNHTGDCGAEGFRDTVENIVREGLFAAGTGDGTAVRSVRGTTIGFLALSDFRLDAVAGQHVLDPETLEDEVRALAQRVDVAVVSIHWGVEGAVLPTPRQRELATRAVRGGARVVVGHGPHTVQPVETLEGAVVAYSLGDLVFDRSGERVVLRVVLEGGKARAELIRLGDAAPWRTAPARGRPRTRAAG
jgi:poly-gamma-glutamate capsule biosynthesis protein CapA/YwtB (metallophosphatase superfamily)